MAVACHTIGMRLASSFGAKVLKGTWSWRTPASDELELLMGFPAGHTHVPLDPDGKKSVKLSEDSRHRLLANSWHVPVP